VIIDFHNHYYPPEYLDAVKQGPSRVTLDYGDDGNPRLHYPGDYNILVPGHRDLDYREGVLREHGVDKQVITFTTPGVHFEEPSTAVVLARAVNDAFAREVKHRQHFIALATLPLNDPAQAVREFDRAVEFGLLDAEYEVGEIALDADLGLTGRWCIRSRAGHRSQRCHAQAGRQPTIPVTPAACVRLSRHQLR
jgi:hypothetical protein